MRAEDQGAPVIPGAVRPPLTPRWVFEPWAWEDNSNTAAAVDDLVEGYLSNGIPLGAVMIDSPWATNYNTFEFGPDYPNPGMFISRLKERGIRVVLWATPVVNLSSLDGPGRGKAATYDGAFAAGYFVNGGRPYTWWKGQGSAIDYFNPSALAWWNEQLDRAMTMGIAGWKLDYAERDLRNPVQTTAGPKTIEEYGNEYYRAFYRYTVSRDPDAVTVARPYDSGQFFAPVDANPVGWVGDQAPSWGKDGIDEAVDNMLVSAQHGYAVLGSDIGGYIFGERDEEQFVRWAQLGALSPFMENGGRGEHRPWKYGPGVLDIYRRYAIFHHELVPYLYGLGIEAHTTGQPIIRAADPVNRQYLLGTDLLVSPITAAGGQTVVELPPGERWHDFWNDEDTVDGPARLTVTMPLDRIPLYIRDGAILPLQVEDDTLGHGGTASRGALTLLIYPTTESRAVYRPNPDHQIEIKVQRDGGNTNVELGAGNDSYILRIKEPAAPHSVSAQQNGDRSLLDELSNWDDFNRPGNGWYYDAAGRYLWIRSAGDGSALTLSYKF